MLFADTVSKILSKNFDQKLIIFQNRLSRFPEHKANFAKIVAQRNLDVVLIISALIKACNLL